MFYYRALFVAPSLLAALATPAIEKEGLVLRTFNNATSTQEFSHFAGSQSDSCPTSCGSGSNEYSPLHLEKLSQVG